MLRDTNSVLRNVPKHSQICPQNQTVRHSEASEIVTKYFKHNAYPGQLVLMQRFEIDKCKQNVQIYYK